jgi:hypothetical protein
MSSADGDTVFRDLRGRQVVRLRYRNGELSRSSRDGRCNIQFTKTPNVLGMIGTALRE